MKHHVRPATQASNAGVTTAKDVKIADEKLNLAMHGVNYWMEDHGLQLATAKTEIVLFTGNHIETIIPIRIGEDRIVTKGNLTTEL